MRFAIISHIARHQMSVYARDWRVLSITLTFLCLYGLCLWSSWSSTQRTRTAAIRLEQDERRRWLEQGTKSPHGAADQGIVTVQPLLNLAAFDPGLLPFAGLVCRLEGHHEDLCTFRPAADASWFARFAPVSPARLVQVFAPLLLILLIYPVVSSERESGILKQILAAGVSSGELVTGKVIAVAGAIAPILIVAFTSIALVSQGDWRRVTALILGYSLFLFGLAGVFFAIAAASSGPGQALTRLAACWFAVAFLGPVAASQIAERIVPAPPPTQWNTDLEGQTRGVPTVEERRRAVRARLLQQYDLTSLRDLPVNPVGVELVEEDIDLRRIWGEGIDRLFRTFEVQDRVYSMAGLLEPVVAIQTLSSAVIETDSAARDRFRQSAEAYRHSIVLKMNDYLVHDPNYHTNPVYVGTDIISTTAGRDLWEAIPPFRYEVPALNLSPRAAWSIASLMFWLFAGLASACVAARRLRAG